MVTNINPFVELAKKFDKNTSSYTDFSATQEQLGYVHELQARPFYKEYRLLFLLCYGMAFLAQIASAISSYHFFASLLSHKLWGLGLIIATVILLLSIEALKYVLVNKSFAKLFALHPQRPFVLLFLAATLSLLSMYASIVGGGNLGIDVTKTTQTTQDFDREIAVIRQEIQAILHRNSWKGSTYLAGKDKNLLHNKELELTQLKQNKEKALTDLAQYNAQIQTSYQIGFGIFECLFVLCSIFIWYYQKRSAVDYLATESSNHIPTTNNNSNLNHITPITTIAENPTPTPPFEIPKPAQRIGFQYDFSTQKTAPLSELQSSIKENETLTNNPFDSVSTQNGAISPQTVYTPIYIEGQGFLVTCLHCGTKVYKKHSHAKFCSDTCRYRYRDSNKG